MPNAGCEVALVPELTNSNKMFRPLGALNTECLCVALLHLAEDPCRNRVVRAECRRVDVNLYETGLVEGILVKPFAESMLE